MTGPRPIPGGTPVPDRGVPQPGQDGVPPACSHWGTLQPGQDGIPSGEVRMGYTPGQVRMGYPLARSRWGTPSQRWGTPQDRLCLDRLCLRWYISRGFVQEHFLVVSDYGAKKSARCSWILVVIELVISAGPLYFHFVSLFSNAMPKNMSKKNLY